MLLKYFYDETLAQASYLIGCAKTGEALVVDPMRDVEPYLAAAAKEDLRITHVTETHIHADFVSGVRELAARTGATMYLSDTGDASWKYAYPEVDRAILVRDGDYIGWFVDYSRPTYLIVPEGADLEDRRGHSQAGPGGGREPAGAARGPADDGDL